MACLKMSTQPPVKIPLIGVQVMSNGHGDWWGGYWAILTLYIKRKPKGMPATFLRESPQYLISIIIGFPEYSPRFQLECTGTCKLYQQYLHQRSSMTKYKSDAN